MAPERRRRWLLRAGVDPIIGFTLLRLTNGDPAPWAVADGALPPALALLACADRARGAAARVVLTFGRVPMIFYIAHIFLLHAVAIAIAGAASP
jgi:uncharacterized membrane protein